MLEFLRQILIFSLPLVLLLSVVVTIHELGHFLVAKWCGVAIDAFSLGFGKPVLKHTDKSGVEWRLGWIPLGGYVKFSGDTNEASVPDADDLQSLRKLIEEKLGKEAVSRFYHFKPVWQRALIAAAGPAANFLLAITIFFAIFMTVETGRTRPVVGGVVPNTPAAAAGFQKGDLIKSVNDRKIKTFEDLIVFVSLRGGDQMNIVVERDGRDILLTPKAQRISEKEGMTGAKIRRGQLGLRADPNAVYFWRASNPVEGLAEAGGAVWMRVETTLTYIGRIFRGLENGDQFSGVVGMAGVTGGATKAAMEQSQDVGGFLVRFFFNMIQLTATISIAVGFVNLLPVPVLDGGHLAFYAYEALAKRPMAAKVQAASFKVGLALVLGLMLFATWNDLQRYDAFRFFGGLIS
jgi:regulator of sigma E protease